MSFPFVIGSAIGSFGLGAIMHYPIESQVMGFCGALLVNVVLKKFKVIE